MNGSASEAYDPSRSCGVRYPEAVLLHRDTARKAFEFRDDVVIARPKAKILLTLLNEIAEIVQRGAWPYSRYNVTTVDSDTEVVSFPSIAEALLNAYRTKGTELCT